ncbi:MAG: hypothetical protein RL367_2469 [Pseudomonadota bacterium]|jgi:hypothetical protein
MDAPLYPPSSAYEAPVRVPQQMATRSSSFADFLGNPAALAIMKSEIPQFERFISNPMLAPHLGNMGPRDMVQFGAFKGDALDRVDAKLKAAGVMQ